MSPDELSRIRQRVRDLYQEMDQMLQVFLGRAPLLKGCVYESRRRCGKVGCICAKGQLHTSKVLAYRGEGKQRNLSPSKTEIGALEEMTSAYQRFRRLRARWVKVSTELLGCIDLLERHRVELGNERLRGTETGRKAR